MGKIAAMLEDAELDILACYAFPAAHLRRLRSTNPLKRFNRDVGRRTDVGAAAFAPERSRLTVPHSKASLSVVLFESPGRR